MDVGELAKTLDVGSTKLEHLLYSLVDAGLLIVEGQRFSNTAEADHYLVRGKATYMGERHHQFSDQLNSVLRTSESIRTGAAKAKLNFHEMTPEQEETVYRGLHPTNLATGRILPTRYDFSAYRTLLDLGGGSGGLAIGVTEECPHIHATVVDLPEVLAIAQRFIAETGANDRVYVMAADVLSGSINGSFDVVVMSNFIQGFSQDEARRAIKNVIKAVEPGGSST